MRPVAVARILAETGRLGITEMVASRAVGGSVRRLLCQADLRSGGGPPSPGTLLILPPQAGREGDTTGPEGTVDRSGLRDLACLALPAASIGDGLRRFARRERIPLFSSCYGEELLHSRLTGLLREAGERQLMVHGVLVRVAGRGVLLVGDSGIGKTECGVALVDAGGAWVADDAVVLEGRGALLYGRGHRRTAGWIALRGRGLLRVAALFGEGRQLAETPVDLIVRLARAAGRMPAARSFSQELAGVLLPGCEIAADVDPRRVANRVIESLRSPRVRPHAARSSAEPADPNGFRGAAAGEPAGGFLLQASKGFL